MSLKNHLKDVPLARWVWNRTPAALRNWVGARAPELSTDERPPAYRLAGHAQVRMQPGRRKDLSALTALLTQAHFILHIGESAESIHHVDSWLPYMITVDKYTVVVFRSWLLFERVVRERPYVNAVYIRDARQTEWLITHMPRLVAVFYDANTGSKVHFIRFFRPRHVFLGHGDSEKAASCGKQFRSFDEVWTAGQAHIDRFAHNGTDFSSLRFRIVGRPQTRPLLATDIEQTLPKFLYLPTWEAYFEEQNYSSIHLAKEFLRPMVKRTGKTAVAKFHPGTGKRNRALRNIEKELRQKHPTQEHDVAITVVERGRLAIELMTDAAFLVADISSVVSDFLVTGRPIFLYVPANRSIQTTSSVIPPSNYCYIFASSQQLLTLVEQVIVQGDDSLRTSRLRARDYFVNTEATRNRAFETALRQLASGQVNPADTIRLLT